MNDAAGLIARYRDRVRREVLEQGAAGADPRAALAARTRALLRGELALQPGELDRVVEAMLDDALGAGNSLGAADARPGGDRGDRGRAASGVCRAARTARAEPLAFEDEAELRHVIERIVSAVGRRVDESSPMVDARLADGSRVNAASSAAALDGP